MPGEFRPPESLEEKLARLRSTYSEQQARHNPFYDAAPAADDMDEEDVPFAPTPRDTYWDWDIGIPAPFDLSRGERKLFNDAVSSFVVRAGTVFSQHGAEMQTPSGSEAGYRGARASWGQTQTPLGGQAAPWAKLGVWGHRSQPEPHPTLMGNIITPVLEMQRDESGFQTNVVRPENFIAAALERGRGIAQEQIYGNRAKGIAPLYQEGMPTEDFESMVRSANRTGMAAVRSSVGMFATSVWAERYAWPYGQREAMRNAVQLQNTGEYGLNPRDVFGALAPSGYFTRKAFASRDKYNPERSTWPAYDVSSLAAGGWLYDPNQRPEEHGVFTTDVELGKIPKRRQLFVQDIAVTHGERNQRRGRWTGDRGAWGNALLLANYPISEGTAVISPDAAPRGFWKHTTQFVERPSGVANWEVLWNKRKLTEPGAPLVFGTQMVDGREQPFLPIKGREGVRQSLWNVKYINEPNREGYELSIGQLYPSESGSFKMMHNGMKALMMKSASIINSFRSSSGIQNIDVVGPLPKSFSLLQHGMIDLLPKKALMPMLREGGLSEEEATRYIRGRNREPLYDALTKAMRSDKYRVDFTHEINVGSRELEALRGAGILTGDPRQLEGNRFMAPIRMVGYNIPIPLQYRQEYPGRKPFYSGEVLKALATKMGGVEAEFAGQARVELARLTRGNPFANILGAALATAGGGRPKRSIGYNEVPWLSISGAAEEMGLPGNEGLLQALQDSMKQSNAKYIVGPEGLVLPSPRDVLRMGERNLQGKQLSRFVTSYGRAISALRDQPENLQEVMAEFRGELSTMAGHSNVRRHALGTALKNAVEGPYVGHVGIPDEYIVGGDDALMKFGGLTSREDLASFKERISAEPFLLAGTRNPIVDKERQLETVMRLVTPEMAKKMWDVDIEDLGRNVATSTFFAVTQRGDFDADRAIFRALTRKLFGSGEMFTPDFYTLDYNGQRRNMLRALQAQSPQAFEDYLGRVPPAERALVEAGMAGRRRGTGAAMARATYGIRGGDAGWNEAAKWAESLEAPAIMKGPMLVSEMYRYTGSQVIDAFRTSHVEPKSNMGVIYNQFIRALPALARGVKEEAAANALGAVAYQSTVDMQKLERALGVLLDLTYFQGAGGTMHRRYSDPINRQDEWYPVGGPAGTLGVLMKQIQGLPISTEMQAALFSRDPRIQSLFKQGNLDAISTALRGKEREFLSDPTQAGPLIELVRSQQFAKQSWATVSKTPAEAQQMATGEGIRAYRQLFSKSELSPSGALDAFRTAVDRPGEMEYMQNLLARRTSMREHYFWNKQRFANKFFARALGGPLPGGPTVVGEEGPELIINGMVVPAGVFREAQASDNPDAYVQEWLAKNPQTQQATSNPFAGPSPSEIGGVAGQALDRVRQRDLLNRANPTHGMSNAEISRHIYSGQTAKFDLTDDPQAAMRFATQHTVEQGWRMKITSPDRGKTIYASASPNQDWWKSYGRGEILRGFEEAARRDTDPTTGYRVHSASEGQVYSQWLNIADRPTEAQLSAMALPKQLTAREKIVSSVLDVIGQRKLNLGEEWQRDMPLTGALYERNVAAISKLREQLPAMEASAAGRAGGLRQQMPQEFEGILQKAVAGNVPSSDELNLIARTMGAGWEGRLRGLEMPNEAQLGAMNPRQLQQIARSRLGTLAQAKRAFGEQEPEWLKNEYASAYDTYRQIRQGVWNEPLVKGAQQEQNLRRLANYVGASGLSSDDESWIAQTFGTATLGNITSQAGDPGYARAITGLQRTLGSFAPSGLSEYASQVRMAEREAGRDKRARESTRRTGIANAVTGAIENAYAGQSTYGNLSSLLDYGGQSQFRDVLNMLSLPPQDALSQMAPKEREAALIKAAISGSRLAQVAPSEQLNTFNKAVREDWSKARQDLTAGMKQESEARARNTAIIEAHTETLRGIVEGPAGQRAASSFGSALSTAQAASLGGSGINQDTFGMLQAGEAFYKRAGMGDKAAEFARAQEVANLQAMAEEYGAGGGGGGIGDRIRGAFSNAGNNRRQATGMMGGYLGALNFGMWGAQMWWKWTGAPVQQWSQQYADQQMMAQQAAFAAGQGGGGLTGTPLAVMQTRANVASAKWYLGEAGWNRWGTQVDRLTNFISDQGQTVAQPIVDTMAIAGVTGLAQLGLTTVGQLTGLKGLSAIGPYRLAGSAIRAGAGIAGEGLTGLGITAAAWGGATGLIGGVTGLAGLGAVTSYGAYTANKDLDTLQLSPLLRGLAMSASGGSLSNTAMYLGLKAGDILSGGKLFSQQIGSKSVAGTPTASDKVTQMALSLKKYGIDVDTGTQMITTLNQMLGREASQSEVEAFAKQGTQYPGGLQQQASIYDQLMAASGTVYGTVAASAIITGSSGLTPSAAVQRLAGTNIASSVLSRYGIGAGQIATEGIGLASAIAQGQPAEAVMRGYALQRGAGGIATQYGITAMGQRAIALEQGSLRYSLAEQEAQQAVRGTNLDTLRAGGLSPEASERYTRSLSTAYSGMTQEIRELTVTARNVTVQTGRGDMGSAMGDLIRGGFMSASTTPAMRQAMGQRYGGLAGLAPSTMVAGGTQAATFEQGLPLVPGLESYQTTASQILNQVRPAGYSQLVQTQVAMSLYSGMSPGQAMSQYAGNGQLGYGASMGYGMGTGASGVIDSAIRQYAPKLTGQTAQQAQSAFVGLFGDTSRMNPQQIAEYAKSLSGFAVGALAPNSKWSQAALNLKGQLDTRTTPWGYSMGLAQDAGMSLQQLYAGQTAPGALQDIYGREAGYAGLFAAQQASGWANYRLSAASIPIQRAQWERQQATTRMEYGGGALQPLQNVMLALSRPRDEQGNLAPTINPTGLPGGEIGVSGEVGVGLNVGGSAIGLVQQEAGIRRQMWQENLNAQRASIGFQQQQLQIAREQLQLSKQEYGVRREYQITEREAGRSQSLLQRSWATQDYNIGQQRMGVQQQWAQEDVDRAIRYSSGRERQQLLRQRDRMQVTQGWERDDSQRNRRRQEELWRREDERYSNAVKYEEQLNAIQMQKFALQEKSLALQEAQLAAQAAHIENIAKLQTDLQKIEDDRFKNQYDNIQAQLKEEEILQPLREDAQRAELAYMALRLQHAQEMHDAEIAAWKAISGFIESMYNAQKNGGFGPPPTEPGGPTAGTWVLGANGWTWNAGNSGAERSPTRAPRSLEQPVINTSKGGQPVVVEIMMDTQKVGEILLTPDRLRRSTKVLLEREKWR